VSDFTALHLFCGLGGAALGFQRAGLQTVGAIDCNDEALADFERLVGIEPTEGDLAEMGPRELRAASDEPPDVVAASPPCKSFSSCLPQERAESDEYRELSSLAQRGIWLTLEAFSQHPPKLLVMENVPRIETRGREWLDETIKMLRSYDYAVEETTHDCGQIGRLPQRRERYLLVARHRPQVETFLYEPPKREYRAIGDVLAELPVPASSDDRGGAMHRLTRLSALNWARLAAIPPDGDFRDLPERIETGEMYSSNYGVTAQDQEGATVRASHSVRTAEAAWADPRVDSKRREGSLGVQDWGTESATVIGSARIHNWPSATADPRLSEDSRLVRATHRLIKQSGEFVIVGPSLDLESQRSADPIPVIKSLDNCWHRPFTTLELAALQGLPVQLDGTWLELEGTSKSAWRERIGNAVPPPAAESVAEECIRTLEVAKENGFHLSDTNIWVDRNRLRYRQ
jgi:site-specific DNA-cytosine methylase